MEEQQTPDFQEQQQPEVTPKKSSFSRLLKITIAVLLIWWFNNCTLKTTKVSLSSKKINNEIHIAVISDYHAIEGKFSIRGERVINKIKKIDPDFVCVLGDMHSLQADENEKQLSMDLMTGIIKSGYKLFFVLGEHDDRTNGYVEKMKKNGIRVLDDEHVSVAVKDSKINIYGISNAYFSPEFDLRNQFDIDKNEYNILMAHIPMYGDYEKFGADLTLCGDTHGAIIQIPLLGPLYFDNEFFPERKRDKSQVYDKGLFDYSGGHMFITSGIGNNIKGHYLPIRFFNRPEIASITISP